MVVGYIVMKKVGVDAGMPKGKKRRLGSLNLSGHAVLLASVDPAVLLKQVWLAAGQNVEATSAHGDLRQVQATSPGHWCSWIESLVS